MSTSIDDAMPFPGSVTFSVAIWEEIESDDDEPLYRRQPVTFERVKDLVDKGHLPKSVLTEDRAYRPSFGSSRRPIEWADEGCQIQVGHAVRDQVRPQDRVVLVKSVGTGEVLAGGRIMRQETLPL